MAIRLIFPPIFFLLLVFLGFILLAPLSSEGDEKATGIRLLSSDLSGVTLELKISSWKTEAKELDGKRFEVIGYPGSGNSSDIGNPMLPVSRAFIGVPVEANISIQLVNSLNHSTLSGKRIPPVPNHVVQRDSNGIETLVAKYVEAGTAYRQGGSYPQTLVSIVEDGYIRNQRVVLVELRPVQYDPSARRVKLYSSLTARVNFHNFKGSTSYSTSTGRNLESEAFERFFENNLINYQTAKNWRVEGGKQKTEEKQLNEGVSTFRLPPSALRLASALRVESRYKILVEKSGIYKLTQAELKEKWGVDLSTSDPRTFRIENRGSELPIYVSGEQDGKFDPQDHIEFYGIPPENPNNIYTRWNVYWLIIGDRKGLRMASRSGQPADPSPQFVNTFKSKIHFEEDHKQHKLQRVLPEQVSPNDRFGWFEARDHWFWDGISNSGELNELILNFTTYDPAQSEVRPLVKVMLQGGTPVNHNALVSANGYKIDNPKWSEQQEILIKKFLPAGSLIYGVNKLTAVRIDTDTDDETQNYPYHFYINWFEVEYMRLLKSVNDRLDFTSPELEATTSKKKAKTFEFTIHGFLSDDIEIFEIDKNAALAKINNLKVEKVGLSFEEKERIRRIVESVDKSIPVSNFAYDVSFQYPANPSRQANFIAVSNRSLLKPFKVVKAEGVELKDPRNSADYIIIHHPVYQKAAQNLAEWKADPRGGNFKVKLADVTKIYDEFNFGMVNPKAIKDFLKYAFENWTKPAPSYVLILGDGTWDFLGIDKKVYPVAPELAGYIPTFYIWTQFGQTAIDHWYATVSGNDALPDMFIGRIPVENPSEADAAIQKTINYEKNPINGDWRRTIISVADDGSSLAGDDIFKSSLTDIAANYTLLGYKTKAIYLEDFQIAYEKDKKVFGGKRDREVVYNMIIDSLSEGAILSQYAGHGGNTVWAHEIIFDIPGIQELRETDKLPFMLVLSCYNGYFDNAGQMSMAEAMIRQRRRGIIGMLSATRLTYGTGNYALNTIIFDQLFRKNVRRLGDITFNSKVIMLATEGMSWLDSMEQYTLFGDPALSLAMADYEIQPTLENSSVSVNKELKVMPGNILKPAYNPKTGKKEYAPISNFNGKLTATVKYPSGKTDSKSGPVLSVHNLVDEIAGIGGKTDSKSVSVASGRFGEISFSVPSDAGKGNGFLEIYAEDRDAIAIGGVTFSVSLPKILEIQTEVVNETSMLISAKLTDDAGLSGIKSAAVRWFEASTANWLQFAMNPDPSKGSGWYRSEKAIPMPQSGRRVTYQIIVTDSDGNESKSPVQDYELQSKPNLYISDTDSDPNAISYIYSPEQKAWGVMVKVINKGNTKVDKPSSLYLFEGNPDRDKDKVVDKDAKAIANVEIDPKDWILSTASDLLYAAPPAKRATIFEGGDVALKFIKSDLKRGRHLLFAWVDPEFNPSHLPERYGTIEEEREDDNVSRLIVDVANYLIGADRNMKSSDDVISVNFPSLSSGDFIPLIISGVKELPEAANQPGLAETPLPNPSALGYKLETYPKLSNLKDPYLIEVKFDIDQLRKQVAKSLNIALASLADKADKADKAEVENPQKVLVDEKLKEEIKNASVYIWKEEAKRWAKLKSAAALDANGNIAKQILPARITPENTGIDEINIGDIRLDRQLTAPGDWVIMFESAHDYRFFYKPEAGELREVSRQQSEAPRLLINISAGFEFGDVIKLKVGSTPTDILFQGFADTNDGDGVIKDIRFEGGQETSGLIDKWVVLFVDSERFMLLGAKYGTAKGADGKSLLGKVGEEFHDSNSGLSFIILSGDRKFEVGDKFKFDTKESAILRATTSQVGIVTVMRSSDFAPPNIQISVGSQNFVDGDPISSKPNIQALIFDSNGIDVVTRKIEVKLSRNSASFVDAKESELLVRSDINSNNVIVNYRPELQVGRYELQIMATDFNGNEAKEKIRFEVKDSLQLLSVMNYPNPFKKSTKITCEVTAEMDEMVIKIYSVSGRLIRTIRESEERVGFMDVNWDGTDEKGEEVANGPYYCKVMVKKRGNKDLIKYIKMMKLR